MPLVEAVPGFVRSGKVRDIFALDQDRLLLVASDRISAFDVVLPTPIPNKGRVLTGLARFWFRETARAGIELARVGVAAASQQVQQLKLASLGRLTASIAHEIRNPLGAISHAGELLGESPALEPGDSRLIQIILDQSRRVNAIVENVLQLGRRGESAPESFLLVPWLERFIAEFCSTGGIAPADVALHAPNDAATVRFDTGHLHQILWNLCQNALRHAPTAGSPKVEIAVERGADGATILAVCDHGAGIAAEVRPHIFEPVFTTDPQSTGLGLYIPRETAEDKRAELV